MSIEQLVTGDVFGTVVELLAPLVGDLDVLGIQITRDTAFHDDLELESIDLVTFASILTEHYGPDVDLAGFLSQMDLDDVIVLRVGDIADFVAKRLAERGVSLPMPTMTVNGLRTNVQLASAGDTLRTGETVVFLHGMGTDSLASFYLTLAPPVAAAGIDVISYDLRGHGKTERPHSGYTIADFLDDLDDLLTQLDVDRPVHLIGNSFGGTLAFSYAAEYPDRVRSIVCIESEPATEVWADKMTQILDHTVNFLAQEESFAWIEANFSAHHRRLARLAADRIINTRMAQEVPLGPLLSLGDVEAIRCPVLSILGRDGYQSEDLEALTSLLPRGELHVFDGQGHSVLVERHREVRELVLAWIARQAG